MCGGLAFFWLRLYASNNNPSWTTDLGIKGRNLHLQTVLVAAFSSPFFEF